MLQAIVFDYDGTISPTNLRQYKWFQFWAKENNSELPFEGLESFMRFYNHNTHLGGVQKVYDELNLPCDMNDKNHPVWPAYERFKTENPAGLYPGVKDAVLQLWEMGHLQKDPTHNKRVRLAINTTNTWASIRGELMKEDLLQCFDCHVTEEVLAKYHGAGKPDEIKKPSKISLALALGLVDSEGDRTLHVGDTINDLLASQKVFRLYPNNPETMITVGVSWGYEGREKLEKGAETEEGQVHFDYIIDKPQELVELVKEENLL